MIKSILIQIGFVAVFAGAGSLLMMHNQGTISKQSKEIGIKEQALAQKDQAIAQERQRAAEEAAKLVVARERHRIELEAIVERQRQSEQSLRESNELLDHYRAMRDTDEELQAWADRPHPDSVRRLLNAASGYNSPRTDSGDEGSDSLSTEGPD